MSLPALGPAVDTLVIGHVAADRYGSRINLGGTAAYAGLTSRALGSRVGVVTSAGPDLDLSPLAELSVVVVPSATSTVFENRETDEGRRQSLLSRAAMIPDEIVPATWRNAALVHLAPIAAEIDLEMVNSFPGSFLGVTAQGWLRGWGPDGTVLPSGYTHALPACARADAVVVSLEDLGGREDHVLEFAAQCRVLAVTLGQDGVRVFTRGSEEHVPAPPAKEIDSTGAGDIFAAAFFHALQTGSDPRESARFAQQLAAPSVSRRGLAAVPSAEEARRSARPVPP